MKKINYEEIIKEAKRKELSPHTIVKRLLKYRKATGLEAMCIKCKSLNKETIDRQTHSGQCEVIGEGFNGYSAINLKFTCDNHNK